MLWLKLNASAVHILTLTAGLIIVGLLAAITWKYRKRPSKQPAPVDPGESPAVDAEAAMRRELQAQVGMLSRVLNALPVADSARLAEAMLNGDDLRDFPFARFRILAGGFGVETDSAAALVETNMRWLSALIQEIRAVRSGMHYEWDKFPRRRYNEVVRATQRPLKMIISNLDLRENEQGSAPPLRG